MLTPGMRTSEFLVTVVTLAAAALSGAENWVPNRYAWLGGVLAAIGYAISRGLAKTENRQGSAGAGG